MKESTSRRILTLFLEGLPGWALFVSGLAISFVSLQADNLGIGGQVGIVGWKQMIGIGLGLATAAGGLTLALRLGRAPAEAQASKPIGEITVESTGTSTQVYDSAAPRLPFVFELRELYRYRYLLWNLVSRDLKVRYKRSILGFLWAMINPLLTMIVMAAVFLNIFKVRVENYPIYLLSGILLWRLFAGGTVIAMRSVLGNSGISKKIYVPSSVFVAASIGSALVNLMFALVPLLLLSILMGVMPKATWLYLPIPILQITLFSFGIGLIVAALAVFFADMLDIYEVFTNAYFYLTPIMYPVTILPAFLLTAEKINPMYYLIGGFRGALIDGQIPNIGPTVVVTLVVLLITAAGWSLFTRLSDQFPYLA